MSNSMTISHYYNDIQLLKNVSPIEEYRDFLIQVIHCMNCYLKTTILFLPIFICMTSTCRIIKSTRLEPRETKPLTDNRANNIVALAKRMFYKLAELQHELLNIYQYSQGLVTHLYIVENH